MRPLIVSNAGVALRYMSIGLCVVGWPTRLFKFEAYLHDKLIVMRFWMLLLGMLGCTGLSAQLPPPEVEQAHNERLVQQIADQRVADRMDSLLTALHEKGYFNGSVLAVEEGRVVFEGTYGLAERKPDRPLTDDSVFELASVSKQFTAMGVMLLVEEGKIDPTAPAMRYLPELAAYPRITVGHLVHHRSGLPDYLDYIMDYDSTAAFITNDTVLRVIDRVSMPLDFTPGDAYAYSNTNYLLLATLIERVSGQSFGDFLRARIFEPLEMHRTSVYQRRYAPRVIEDLAHGYVYDGVSDQYVLPDSTSDSDYIIRLDGVVGDGMVNSTLGDLHKWSRALDHHTLLSPEATERYFTSPAPPDEGARKYAWGWVVQDTETFGLLQSHSGGWPGYNTHIDRYPESERLLIVLRNDNGGPDQKVNAIRNLRRIFFDKPLVKMEPVQHPDAVAIDVDDLKPYEGVYAVSSAFKLRFFVEGERLITQATGQQALPLTYIGDDTFYIRVVEAKIIFKRDDTGQPMFLVLHQNGQQVMAMRE